MRRARELLAEYGESHQHPVNKLLHWVCVPLIVLSLLGLLWSIPMPGMFETLPFVNAASLLLSLTVVYYLFLSPPLAVGMLLYAVLMVLLLAQLDNTVVLWQWSCVVFVLAWIGQFIGHYIEGKRPSFFKDIQFLLIGPLWLLAAIYRKLHLAY